MAKKIFLTIILILFFTQGVFALIANSSSYSIGGVFGSGLQASTPSSSNLEARLGLFANAGTRNAESSSYSANGGFFRGVSPYPVVSITSYSIYPRSNTGVSIIRLYISALNAQTVWAEITRPDGVTENIVLSNSDYTYYTAGIMGTYNVVFYANSSTGAVASIIDSFELREQTTPPPTTSSGGGTSIGGGGTTTIIEKCTYIWDCTPWSLCSEGKQTRECKNVGNCNGTENKPAEETTCSESLFDINLKLRDIKPTSSKSLIFNVDLTETMNKEKIDVHIKYSIIDKNNTEIFSQIETKAIQGNLSFQKEIDEIKLSDGEYILRVDILYGNLQRAFAEQKFEVGKVKTQIESSPLTGRIIENIDFNLNNSWIGFLVLIIIGIFVFLIFRYRKRILAIHPINAKKLKHSKNSIKSLIKKKVYCGEGNYLGKVKEVFIEENKIISLRIILDRKKKKEIKWKGIREIEVKYSNVKTVGEHIVIIDNKIMDKLESLVVNER